MKGATRRYSGPPQQEYFAYLTHAILLEFYLIIYHLIYPYNETDRDSRQRASLLKTRFGDSAADLEVHFLHRADQSPRTG